MRDTWWSSHTECLKFALDHRRGWDFGYVVSTDGVSVSIGFIKADTQPPPLPQDAIRGVVSPSGANPINLQCPPRIVGLDPGRINILTAVVHSQQAADTVGNAVPSKYETIQYTSGRWYEASGANFRTAKVHKWLRQDRPVRQAIRSTPSAKTASAQTFQSHATHRLQHTPLVSAHFSAKRYPALRWRSYISRQKAFAEMCNIVTANDPDTVVAFGDASFSHNSRGRKSSLTTGLRRQLAGQSSLYRVDEHNTSALCCACHEHMQGMGLGTGMGSTHTFRCGHIICTAT